MAITWDISITNVDVDQKRADIRFTRTDDITDATESYGFSKAIIETGEERTALLNQAWQNHLDAVAKQTAVDAFITNLEQLAKANLEAREV